MVVLGRREELIKLLRKTIDQDHYIVNLNWILEQTYLRHSFQEAEVWSWMNMEVKNSMQLRI